MGVVARNPQPQMRAVRARELVVMAVVCVRAADSGE